MNHGSSRATERGTVELERVARRWQQLPFDHALRCTPGVLVVTQQLADEVAAAAGLPHKPVPDLGPAVVMDQLAVMVFDYGNAQLPPGHLEQRLAQLRKDLG